MRIVLLLLVGLALGAWAQDAGTLNETSKHYQIHVRYPKFKAPALTSLVEDYAKKQVADFKKQFQEDTQGKGDRMPWTLDLDYTLPWHSERLQSVYFVGSAFTGGAHPSPFLQSFVLDLKTGKPLTLNEQFTGDYLGVFSQYAIAELGKRDISSEPGWVAKGAAPTPENYSVGYPTEGGYLVVFPPYQVAPYVAGPQEVLVPWSLLAQYRRTLD